MTKIRRWVQGAFAGENPRASARDWTLLIAAGALIVAVFGITTSLRVVTVEDSNGFERTLFTTQSSTNAILTQADIQFNLNDELLLSNYGGTTHVFIQRAFSVGIEVDGTSHSVSTTPATVQSILQNAEITLGEHDYCEPSLATVVSAGDVVNVHRVEYADTVTLEAVPSPVEYKLTPLIRGSKTYVIEEGTPGTKEVTYRERIVDGELESAQVVSETLVTPATTTVILKKGDVWVSDVAGPEVVNNAPVAYSSVMYDVVCTGYYSATGRGASRLGLYAGTVAVNPNVIPYGTRMFITSPDGSFVYGYAIATDTGTALMEGIIGLDLFYESYRESALNGKKLLTVYIL